MRNRILNQKLPNEVWRIVFFKFVDYKNPKFAWSALCLLEERGFKTTIQHCGIKEQFLKKYTPEWINKSWKLLLEYHKNMPEEYTKQVFRNLIHCAIDSHDVIDVTASVNIDVDKFGNQPLGKSMLIGPINETMTDKREWIIVPERRYPVLVFAWIARMQYDGMADLPYGYGRGPTMTVTRFVALHVDDKGYNWVPLYPKQLKERKKQGISDIVPILMIAPNPRSYGVKTELINSDHERQLYLDYNIASQTFANFKSLKSITLSLATAIDTYLLDFCYIPSSILKL